MPLTIRRRDPVGPAGGHRDHPSCCRQRKRLDGREAARRNDGPAWLLLKVAAALLTYAVAALTLAHRWAKAGDQRLWSEV